MLTREQIKKAQRLSMQVGGESDCRTQSLIPRPLKLKDEGEGFGLKVSLPLPPSVNHCYANVAGKGRVLTKRARAYKAMASDFVTVEALCSRFKLPEDARLGLSMMLHFGNHRRNDLDNICKLINDSIASAMGFDDSAIDFLLVRRGEVDKSNPRCEVTLTVL